MRHCLEVRLRSHPLYPDRKVIGTFPAHTSGLLAAHEQARAAYDEYGRAADVILVERFAETNATAAAHDIARMPAHMRPVLNASGIREMVERAESHRWALGRPAPFGVLRG